MGQPEKDAPWGEMILSASSWMEGAAWRRPRLGRLRRVRRVQGLELGRVTLLLMIFDLLVEDLGSRPQRGSYRSDHVQMAEPDSDMRQGSAVQCSAGKSSTRQ